MYEIVSRNFLAILLFIIAPPTVKGQESLDNIIVLGDQAKQSPSIEVMDVQGSVKDKHFKISVHKNFKVAGVYNNKQFQIRFPHNLSNFNIDMSSISWGGWYILQVSRIPLSSMPTMERMKSSDALIQVSMVGLCLLLIYQYIHRANFW